MQIFSDITGTVWKLEVGLGQAVAEGDTLVIVESMKMEIPVCASAAGVVCDIRVAEGEMVEDGQVIMVLE